MSEGLTFGSRILWYTVEFIVNLVAARFPGPVAVLHSWCDLFVLVCCVWILADDGLIKLFD